MVLFRASGEGNMVTTVVAQVVILIVVLAPLSLIVVVMELEADVSSAGK